MPSKIRDVIKKIGRIENDDDIVFQLTKLPQKDKGNNMPHTLCPTEDYINQVDTIFLPNDNGFKYLLVCVDLATRLCDAEPMKNKESDTTRKALSKIYRRHHYCYQPKIIEVDDGTEFKNECKRYFSVYSVIRVKELG